jgi:cytochrome c2
MFRTALLLSAALALGACNQAASESDNPGAGSTAAGSDTAVATAQTPPVYAQCKTCHSVEPGRHAIGPSLAGVHARKAGAAEGYSYSAAMKSAGLTWDDATLDRFIEAPMQTVPGTKMAYGGIKDPAKRAELIAYLKTI